MNEREQYENVCKREFQSIKDHADKKFLEVQTSLDKFYVAIFEGDGEPGLKAQVCMHSKALRGIFAVGGIVLTAIIGCIVKLWFK